MLLNEEATPSGAGVFLFNFIFEGKPSGSIQKGTTFPFHFVEEQRGEKWKLGFVMSWLESSYVAASGFGSKRWRGEVTDPLARVSILYLEILLELELETLDFTSILYIDHPLSTAHFSAD